MSNLKYGIFCKDHGITTFDDLFDTESETLNYAYDYTFKRGHVCLSFFSLDEKTGEIKQLLNAKQFSDKMESWQEEEEAEEHSNRAHGSYIQQHTQTVRDVL